MTRSLTAPLCVKPDFTPSGITGVFRGGPFLSRLSEQAAAQSSAAIAEARRLAHWPSWAASLVIDTRLLSLAGYDAALNKQADELIAVWMERRFP